MEEQNLVARLVQMLFNNDNNVMFKVKAVQSNVQSEDEVIVQGCCLFVEIIMRTKKAGFNEVVLD